MDAYFYAITLAFESLTSMLSFSDSYSNFCNSKKSFPQQVSRRKFLPMKQLF